MENKENKENKEMENVETVQEENAKEFKKLRGRRLVVSLIGIAILAYGLWKIGCLFFD